MVEMKRRVHVFAAVAAMLCFALSVRVECQATAPASAVPSAAKPTLAPDLSAGSRAGLEKHLDDWAQLKRYTADNAALAAPVAGEKRVVFYGDSITDNWGRHAGVFFPGKPYVNRGISGQTTAQMVVRFRQDVIELHPALVVILAGTNDVAGNTGPVTLEQIEGNLMSMVELARANHIKVVLAGALPASYYPWRPDVAPAESIRALNTWIKSYCERERLVYLDYYGAMVNAEGGMKPELASDKFVHPNDAGYAVMQPLAEAAVAKAIMNK